MYHWPRVIVNTHLRLQEMHNVYFQVENFHFPVFMMTWNFFNITGMG